MTQTKTNKKFITIGLVLALLMVGIAGVATAEPAATADGGAYLLYAYDDPINKLGAAGVIAGGAAGLISEGGALTAAAAVSASSGAILIGSVAAVL